MLFPLIRHQDATAAFAYRNGQSPICVGQFLRDVSHLAAMLPDRRYLLNFCTDRYRFVVGFCAALLREQINLLPPNQTLDLIAQLKNQYADVYCLTDASTEHSVLETVFYPSHEVGVSAQVHLSSLFPTPLAGEGRMKPTCVDANAHEDASVNIEQFEVPHIPATQVAALVFTSGSTGQPTPHRKTWGSLVDSALAEVDHLGIADSTGMTILGTVPPQHMYGLESTVLLVLQGGFAMFAGRPFYPADIRAVLHDLPRPRGLVTTPVHLRVLLAETEAVPPIDFMLCATAPLPPQLAAEAESRFAAPLQEIYGCTESGQVAVRRPVETPVWRLFHNLHLRQDDKGTWVKGGHVETEILLNDVIELREENSFLLHGRTTDLINIAGKRTSLANLNYHLNSIPGVLDGVFLMPDDADQIVARLMAFVVAPELTSDAVLQALRQRVDAAFLPRPLYFVAELPRNATGKLTREALRRLAIDAEKKTE